MKQYDHLKKNLREYTVDVDKEKLWQQTAHAIPQKKKRRAILIPFFFGALLLSGGLAYYHEYTPFVNAFTQVSTETNTAIQKNQPSASTSNVLSTSDHLIKNKGTDRSEYPGPVQASGNEYANNQERKVQKQTQNNVSFAGIVTQEKRTSSFFVDEENTGKNTSIELNETPILINHASLNENEGIHLYTTTEATTTFTRIQRNTNYLPSLPLSQITIDFNSEINGSGHTITPVHQHPGHIFSLYALQSMGLTNLSFDPGNQEAKEMRDYLVPITRSLESFSTTLRGNIRFAKGFAVSAGIAYRRLTTQTNYNQTITERTEQEGTTTIIIDELGQQQFVSGNLGSTHIVETAYNRFSTHKNVDLELTLHKNIFGFHRTTINGYLKAGVNVLYSAEGSAFTDEQELVRFKNTQNPFHLRSPFTYGGGLDIQYRLSPRWILVGAAGIDQLNYHHEDYNQLQWKHTIYALSLGVGYVL